MNRTGLYIALASILLFGLILYTLFEYKEVPDVSWRADYHPDSKEPYGTWMLQSLLKEKYGSENVLHRYTQIQDNELDSLERHLLVMVGDHFDLDFDETDALAKFSNKGNDILILANSIDFDYDWGLSNWHQSMEYDSSFQITYPSISNDSFNIKFRRHSFNKAIEAYYFHFSLNSTTDFGTYDAAQDTFTYSEESAVEDYEYDYDESDNGEDIADTLGLLANGHVVYKEWDFYPERIRIHLLPILFSNQAVHEIDYLTHFDLFFNDQNYDKIILEHPTFNVAKRQESNSPLQFIMAHRELQWAYYTLLLSSLIYIVFKGKRKQSAVPTLQPNNNTSLEYIQTLGSLYENQNQPRKLVNHMKEIFFHDIKGRYYLDRNDPDFNKKLSKKANIHLDDISIITKTFETIHTRYDFTESDLSILYKRIDAFHKNCK